MNARRPTPLARRARRTPILIGIDTGGTFTDLVAFDGRSLRTHKLLSTPRNPTAAVLQGLRELVPEIADQQLTYSSTVATNALLERRGARVVLLTTAGLEDLLEIGRQNRSELYALEPRKSPALVPRDLRLGVAERMLFDGKVLQPISASAIRRMLRQVAASRADAVAVCFLHSYANPAHELQVGEALARQGRVFVSLSHDLVSEYREYERLSTTVINSYVGPIMSRHLSELEASLGNHVRFRVLQSNGGAIGGRLASREAVRTCLSGPAGGVIGATRVAHELGIPRAITFDMGGTSTDVALIGSASSASQASKASIPFTTEWQIAELPLKVPAIDIHTVGAGGGSLASIDVAGCLKVGPQSAGADPGPACYGRGRQATVTDANLVLGRVIADAFLGGHLVLHHGRAEQAVAKLARRLELAPEDAADMIVRVVNAGMERAIRRISVERGYDPRDYALISFGGAGAQHACDLAAALGICRVVVPRHPGLLSAWGAARAEVQRDVVQTLRLLDPSYRTLQRIARPLLSKLRRQLKSELAARQRMELRCSVDARYAGQSYEINLPLRARLRHDFEAAHQRLYGYVDRQRQIEVVNLRISGVGHSPLVPRAPISIAPVWEQSNDGMRQTPAANSKTQRVYAGGRWHRAPVLRRGALATGEVVRGPAIIIELSATTFIPPQWKAAVHRSGHLVLEPVAPATAKKRARKNADTPPLEVFNHRLSAIAEEMGVTLCRSAFSPNIKERRDYSCAVFDSAGRMAAQAAHIPVHLGSTPLSVRAAIDAVNMGPGDVVMLNDPFAGGTHLPDVTMVAPVYLPHRRQPFAYVANRAHHSDIGGGSPGSMALATEIYQEGLRLPPVRLVKRGEIVTDVMQLFLANTRVAEDRRGDLLAQLAALRVGARRIDELIENHGVAGVDAAMQALQNYSEQLMRAALRQLPAGICRGTDWMDDDGSGAVHIPIRVAVHLRGGRAYVDFTGTALQVAGGINANYAITVAAVLYAFQLLAPAPIPANAGLLRPIQIVAPLGSLVNARFPAAVAGGNVETSQRIVDVVLKALARAAPQLIPAASSGTMTNLALGGYDGLRLRQFAYYETIAGGAGAGPHDDGASAIQTHMTNTLNTPIEALESALPVRVTRYAVRRGSGGSGQHRGGDGVEREIEMLAPAQITLLSERRRERPYGLQGGKPGVAATASLMRPTAKGRESSSLPSKFSLQMQAGQRIRIATPGGGGWGKLPQNPRKRR